MQKETVETGFRVGDEPSRGGGRGRGRGEGEHLQRDAAVRLLAAPGLSCIRKHILRPAGIHLTASMTLATPGEEHAMWLIVEPVPECYGR